jgi:hypothetical protein
MKRGSSLGTHQSLFDKLARSVSIFDRMRAARIGHFSQRVPPDTLSAEAIQINSSVYQYDLVTVIPPLVTTHVYDGFGVLGFDHQEAVANRGG